MDDDQERGRARRQRRGFLVRAATFVVLAAVAQASAALPPGPNDVAAYWASLAIFVACACSMLLPWQRLPRWAVLVPTLAYLLSVTLLLISGGTNPAMQSTAGGLSALVLLPVLGMALYYPPSYSVVVVAAATVSLAVVGVVVQSSGATDLRRVLLWTAVSVVVSVTIHHLRQSLQGKVRDSEELARLGRLMNGATQSLTSLRDSKDVIAEGTLVLAELAGAGCTRAAYLRVRDGVVTEEVVVDERGAAPISYLLRDDPYVGEVVDAGHALVTALNRKAMGPTLRYVTDDSVVTHAAFIPVSLGGELHGILRVDGRATPISEEVFARCRALGNVVELALGNAIAHEELELQANSDPLTGLANRRGLALYLDGDRRPESLSILVLDIDGLKAINDAHGHDVGDRILVAVARAAGGTLRGGDLLARTGGDEFVAVVTNADESDARRVAERITAAVSQVKVRGVRTSVSVGHASCGKNADPDRVLQMADEAMYESKRVARRALGHHPRRPGDLVAPNS